LFCFSFFIVDIKGSKNTLGSTSKGASSVKVVSIPYNRIDCHTFFSYRNEVVERALADCQRDLLSCSEEDELIGTWLLTEYINLYYCKTSISLLRIQLYK
jgi:hypothetical protein